MFKTILVATVIAFLLTITSAYAAKANSGQCGVGIDSDVNPKNCTDAAG